MLRGEVTVIVRLRPSKDSAYDLLAALRDDRRDTLSDEPGCRRFSILATEDGTEFVLHEVYEDKRAFEAHKTRPHFAAFEKAARAYCAEEPHVLVLKPID